MASFRDTSSEFEIETTTSGAGSSSSLSISDRLSTSDNRDHDYDDSYNNDGSDRDNDLAKEIALHRFSAYPSNGSPKTEALYLKILEDVKKEQALALELQDEPDGNEHSEQQQQEEEKEGGEKDDSNNGHIMGSSGRRSKRGVGVGFVEDYGDDDLNRHSLINNMERPVIYTGSTAGMSDISSNVNLNLEKQRKRKRRRLCWIIFGVVVLVLIVAGIVAYFVVRAVTGQKDDDSAKSNTTAGTISNGPMNNSSVLPTFLPTMAPLPPSLQPIQPVTSINITTTNQLVIPDGQLLSEDAKSIYGPELIAATNALAASVYLDTVGTMSEQQDISGNSTSVGVRRRRRGRRLGRILQNGNNFEVESIIESWVEYGKALFSDCRSYFVRR